MPYFLDTFLWNGIMIMDINRGNWKKIRGLRTVALRKNVENLVGRQSNQYSNHGTNAKKKNLAPAREEHFKSLDISETNCRMRIIESSRK